MALGLAAALAAGCTNDPEIGGRYDAARQLLQRGLEATLPVDAAPAGQQTASEPAAVQRLFAQLPPGPVIRLDLPEVGQSAFALLDGAAGDHVTFTTFSGQSVSFRGGVVVATRGLVFDLMGADTAGVETAIARRAPSRHERVHRYLGADEQERPLAFTCTLAREDGERVTLVSGESFATTRMRETCQSARFTFNNLYWVASDGAVVRTSQWISRDLGEIHVEIFRR